MLGIIDTPYQEMTANPRKVPCCLVAQHTTAGLCHADTSVIYPLGILISVRLCRWDRLCRPGNGEEDATTVPPGRLIASSRHWTTVAKVLLSKYSSSPATPISLPTPDCL
jgi:hypothetical protein